MAAMAIVAAGFTACGNKTNKGNLNNDVDSLSYSMGITVTEGIDRYLEQMGVDSAYIKEFLKGVEDASKGEDNKKKTAYNLGVSVGVQLSQMKKGYEEQIFAGDSTAKLNGKKFLAGFKDGVKGKFNVMTMEQAQMVRNLVGQRVQTAAMEKQWGPNKKAGEAFIAKKAKEAGVKKLTFKDREGKDMSIYYKVVKEGTGDVPTAQQMVKMEYEGKTIEGKVFDTTAQRGAQTMPAGNFIPGFSAALTHMPVGSTWEIYIPSDAAYGPRQVSDDIKPFSALQFKVTLVSIEESLQPAQAPAAARPQVKVAK